MAKFAPPNVPFVEARSIGGKQMPTTIALRVSFTPSTKGAALAVAHHWHRSSLPIDSCHYVLDREMVYRCVPDRIMAQSLGFLQKGSIWINLCCEPTEDINDWFKAPRSEVLDLAADLTAQLCLAYKIRPVLRDEIAPRSLFNRKSGIIVRIPGAFPDAFLDLVINKIKESS